MREQPGRDLTVVLGGGRRNFYDQAAKPDSPVAAGSPTLVTGLTGQAPGLPGLRGGGGGVQGGRGGPGGGVGGRLPGGRAHSHLHNLSQASPQHIRHVPAQPEIRSQNVKSSMEFKSLQYRQPICCYRVCAAWGETDRLLGLFAASHMEYSLERTEEMDDPR